MAVLLDACTAEEPPARPPSSPSPLETHLVEHLDAHGDWAAQHSGPPSALHRALTFWTRLHGVLSLELAGHFTGMEFDPALLYTAEAEALGGR